jgi:tRNA nucleotidyltransferase (CCA-adding enzyme)
VVSVVVPGKGNVAAQLLQHLSHPIGSVLEAAKVVGEERGVSVYAVGGLLRDLLLGMPAWDLDLTAEGDGIGYAKALASHLKGRVTAYPSFQTATITLPDGLRVDIATARREIYDRPAALPRVFPGTIQEDLARRDFTINAMALRLTPPAFLDPFGGLQDLKGRVIRTLHAESYRDDPTRIFRGVRYAARFGFHFSPRDRRLIQIALAEGTLNRLSRDRLLEEWKLLFEEPRPEAALKRLDTLGVLRAIDPALSVDAEVMRGLRKVRSVFEWCRGLGIPSEHPKWQLYLRLILLPYSSGIRRRVGLRLGLPESHLRRLLKELTGLPHLLKRLEGEQLRSSTLRHLLDRISREALLLLWVLGGRRVKERIGRYLTHLALVKPALTGKDLQALGISPGPRYRQILDALLKARLDGEVQSRQEEVELVQRRFARSAIRKAR